MAIKILFRIEVNRFSEKSSKNMKKLEIQIQRHIYVSFFHFECPLVFEIEPWKHVLLLIPKNLELALLHCFQYTSRHQWCNPLIFNFNLPRTWYVWRLGQ